MCGRGRAGRGRIRRFFLKREREFRWRRGDDLRRVYDLGRCVASLFRRLRRSWVRQSAAVDYDFDRDLLIGAVVSQGRTTEMHEAEQRDSMQGG